MSEKPLVDRSGIAAVGVRRLLMLGGALLFIAALLTLLGHAWGGTALVAIFAFLAMVGIAAVFALALGFMTLTQKTADAGIGRAFLDAFEVGTLLVDRNGRIIYANRAYGDAIGAADPTQIKSLERILARERDASEAVYRLANRSRNGDQAQEDFRLERSLSDPADREPHWYRVSVRPMHGVAGAAHAWQILDITTDRIQQETFFQDLQHAIDYLDHAPAGFFASDPNGRIAYVNATLASWLGFDLASFRPYDRSLADLLGSKTAERIAEHAAQDDVSHPIEVQLDAGTGEDIPVRIHVNFGSIAEAGAFRAIIVKRDPDDHDENTLHAAEQRFTRFFNSSPIALAALDAAGSVVRSNPAFDRVFARSATQTGETIVENVRAESRNALQQAIEMASRGHAAGPPFDIELAGEPSRSIRTYVSGIADAAYGARASVILYGLDITEQRALEEQFAKAQRMQAIGNLAGGIAHDFNNVLTIITASVDFLLLNHRSGDPAFQDLLLIKQSANRAASLVRQLLAYSRRQTMRPKMLNLTDVIADMNLLLKRISGDLVKLERHHSRDLWPVMADIGQFEQVITNLVGNARDAMPDGGTITVSTRNVVEAEAKAFGHAEMQSGDFVLVEVADNGTGMPPEVAERIFEPFFTTKEIGKGTGLGLSMVYGIVKQSGGFIFVDSTVGQGTVFRIFLPRHVSLEAVTAKTETPVVPNFDNIDLSGTASILLVEDEDHVRAGNVRALKMRGYEVHEAASGVEALDVLEELGGKIDLIVSDVVMPEMDGPTLLREMRSRQPDLKFIFVSGYAEDAFAKNLPENEKFGFLAKPFSLRELAVAVKQMLEE